MQCTTLSKCVIALWFSVWWEEIAQVPVKSQQQRWWELWVQEQKQGRDIHAHAEERAGEVEVMGKPALSLLVPAMKSSLGDILGTDTSAACVTLYWSHQMTLLGNCCYHHLAKELQAVTSGNFHLSPTESVLQRYSGCYQVVVAGAELHRHCGSGRCYKPTEQSVQLRLDLHAQIMQCWTVFFSN